MFCGEQFLFKVNTLISTTKNKTCITSKVLPFYERKKETPETFFKIITQILISYFGVLCINQK